MADLTKEVYEALPDLVKADYEQDGEVYRHKAEGKSAKLKSSLDALDAKSKGFEQRIREIEAKAEEDRTKAEQAALDKLKKEGKLDEILADYERRAGETKKQYEERIEKLTSGIKNDVRKVEVLDIASGLKVFDDSRKLFEKLISDRIEVDPETRKVTYLDENGSATSLDKAGFIAELAKDSAFDRMRQADQTRGGVANGNNGSGGGASKILTRQQFETLNAVERSKFFKEGGKLKD